MSKTLIKNIGSILAAFSGDVRKVSGKKMKNLPGVDDAFVLIEGAKIRYTGQMKNAPETAEQVIDAKRGFVLPAFCDSHTHLVYAGSREQEFRDRVMGLSYEEIARRGGGILNSVKRLHKISEQQLYEESLPRVHEIINQGTGAVEIKSGYGLNTADELKMLRVIRRLKESTPLTVRATFLGAHAFPAGYKNDPDSYVDLIISEMIPVVAGEGLADFIDVFCDRGFFTPDQTARILEAGMKHGLQPKIHANELDFSGGVQVGVQHHALSVDHLEYVGDEEISVLKNSNTIPVALPGASFFLGLPYAPARKMMDSGLPLAIASDFNPGSSPSGNMKLMMSLACTHMRMLPEEALIASTLNGAYAMGISDELGSIVPGKKANLIITKPIPSLAYIPYAYGSDIIYKVMIEGREV
ncbi:MAG: imidazolonepropionase [Chlorobi bacterium]|nr:imidazolonepropionase [Chlorobiota bacterium]